MIVDSINKWATLTPNKPAVIQDDIVINYHHFARIIEASRRFIEPPVMPQNAVAIIVISNPLDAWVVTLAARSLGYTTLTVFDIALAFKTNPSNVACVITTEADLPGVNAQRRQFEQTPLILIPHIVYGEGNLATIKSFSDSSPTPGGHICLTSGSTGSSKKIFYSGHQEKRRLEAIASLCGYTASTALNMIDRAVLSSVGYKYPLAVWNRGGAVLFYTGAQKFRSFGYQGVNMAHLNPTQADQFCRAREDAFANPAIRMELGGGFLSQRTVDRIHAAVSPNVVIECGCTEKWLLPFKTSFKRKGDLVWYKPRDASEVEIVDEHGHASPVGVSGTLRYKVSEFDPAEYLDDVLATAQSFRDGYFYPGDLAVRREDGRVRMLGRVSDVIILQGDKYPVALVEQELRRELDCSSVFVFSTQGEDGSEQVGIVIEGGVVEPNKARDLLLRRHPSAGQVLERWVRSIPYGVGGKVDRIALRQQAFGA